MEVGLISAHQVYESTIAYIKDRRENNSNLCTRWDEINSRLMGGFAPNTIFTLGGISGSGKTSLASMIEHDFCTLPCNEHLNVCVLNFSLEMLPRSQVTRKLSYLLHAPTQKILSVGEKIDADLLLACLEQKSLFESMPIFYFQGCADVETVHNISKEFIEINSDKWVVIILDHTLLVEGIGGPLSIVPSLQKVWNELKRIGKTSIIQIAQMNRDLESYTRWKHPEMHYPQRSDFSSSDSMFQISDYVMVLHRPELVNLKYYGPDHIHTKGRAFLHILKNREGELSITAFTEDFMHGDLHVIPDEELKRKSRGGETNEDSKLIEKDEVRNYNKPW